MNPFFSRFAKENVFVATGQILNFAKPLLFTPLILKTAPVEVFGTYVLALSVAGFIGGIAPLGVDFICKRYLPSADTAERKRELFYPQFLFQLGVLAACGLALILADAPLRALFFKGAPDFSMPLVVCYMAFYAAYGQFTDYFRYSNRLRTYVTAGVANPYLAILLVVMLRIASKSFTVNNLLMVEILSLGIIVAWLGIKIITEIGVAIPAFSLRELRESIRLGFPLMMLPLNEFFLFSGSRYVIAAFLGVGSVACFTAASQLGNLALFFPRALGVALPPLLCKAEDSGHKREFSLMLKYSVKGYLLISIPFVALTLLMGRGILEVFSNAEVARQAWLLVPLLALANVIYGVSLILSKIFVVDKKTSILFNASLAACVLSIILNIPLIWASSSILPAGLAILISYAVMFAIILGNNGRCREALGTVDVKGIVAVSSGAVLLAYFGLKFTIQESVPGKDLWISTVAGLLYLILLIVFNVVSKNERDYAKRIFSH